MFTVLVKLLHVLSVLFYFSALFCIGRFFLLYKKSNRYSVIKRKILRRQYLFNIERIWNMVVVPGALMMLSTGLILFFLNRHLLKMEWFELKMIFLSILSVYHYWVLEKIRYLKALQGRDLLISYVNLQQISAVGYLLMVLLAYSDLLKYSIKFHYGLTITGILMLLLGIGILKVLRKET